MNKQERTYTILRERIHAGTYPPLSRLNIDALARELGVSAIPVREALRRLEAESWVHFKRNVGAIVSRVDAASWEQAMTTLAILEGAASAHAQGYLRKSDFARLTKLSAEMADPATHANPLRFSNLNASFHTAIVARCPNRYLVELYQQTHLHLERIRSTVFVYLPHRSRAAVQEHARLIELLQDGSRDAVESYARWHRLQTVVAYRAAHEANDQPVTAAPPLRGRGRGPARQLNI